jgi:DNA-binding LacI/PurR family transcriptional regulator
MTLKKISSLTGFSTSTVSKALNNRQDVNLETRNYIRKIAKKNKYIPNKNAVALRKNKSKTIAVILPHVNDSLYSHILSDIQIEASKSGYRIFLFQSFKNNEMCYLNQINDGSVDGALILSSNFNTKKGINVKLIDFKVEYLRVFENQSFDILKTHCMEKLGKLLNSI